MKRPCGQGVHLEEPDDDENVPGSHAKQAVAPGALAANPGSQVTQARDVETFWYLPGSQAVQSIPFVSGFARPMLHGSHAVAPALLCE
jgi:hypothetical protein